MGTFKKIGLTITLFLMLFILNDKVEALYIGSYNGKEDHTITNAVNSTCRFDLGDLCRYRLGTSIDNSRKTVDGIRVSFVYADGNGNYTQLGSSLDIWKKAPAGAKSINYAGKSKINANQVKSLNSGFSTNYKYAVISSPGNDAYKNINWLVSKDWLQGYFFDIDVMDEYAKALVGCGIKDKTASCYKDTWMKDNQKADPTGKNPAKKGYRFLIEKIRTYADKYGNWYVLTWAEYANIGKNGVHLQTTYLIPNNDYPGPDEIYTAFEDIGITVPTACTPNNICNFDDLADRSKGHSLHIIDFFDFLDKPTVCNFDKGEGFPSKDKTDRDQLTEEEKKCCDQQIEEINKKYPTKPFAQETCTNIVAAKKLSTEADRGRAMLICMLDYVHNLETEIKNSGKLKQELTNLFDKYPGCGTCNPQKQALIEENYSNCLKGQDNATWMYQFLTGQQTKCEMTRTKEIEEYKKYVDEGCPKPPDCPFESGCPNLTPGCDEDNPYHFPPNADKSCCIYFENKMKLEFETEGIQKGLTGADLDAFVTQKVTAWYNEAGKQFRNECLKSVCTLDDLKKGDTSCCDELKNQGYNEQYLAQYGCPYTPPNKCNYDVTNLNNMTNGDCKVNNLTASDIGDWSCIYDSVNIDTSKYPDLKKFKDYYLKYSNPYCSVYCREEVTYNFPKDLMEVQAGYHFTVNKDPKLTNVQNWSPIHFKSVRTCQTASGSRKQTKTDGIDFATFYQEWNQQLSEVYAAWDSWKVAEIQQTMVGYYKSDPNFYARPCDRYQARYMLPDDVVGIYTYHGHSKSSDVSISKYTGCTILSNERAYYYNQAMRAKYNYYRALERLKQMQYDIVACTDWKGLDGQNFYRTAKNYPSLNSKEMQDRIDSIVSDSGQADALNSYIGSSSVPNFTYSSTDATAERYHKYSSYNDFEKYDEFNPDLTIDYKETKYSYNDLLNKTVVETKVNSNFSNSGSKTLNIPDCIHSTTRPISSNNYIVVTMPSCTYHTLAYYEDTPLVTATYTKEVNYTLKNGVFNYILKPQGEAVSQEEANKLPSSQIKINLGYSALHTHFMTPSGIYKIGLSYTKFSPTTNNSLQHNFDKVNNSKKNYECRYKVSNTIIENKDPDCSDTNCTVCKNQNCDPLELKGLNLIYRPISLSNPFPGFNGSGRNPGKNWDGIHRSGINLVDYYIINNRGTKADDVYQKQPMYTITLNAGTIQEIRKYNKTTNYNDFNLTCNGNGKQCESQFIRGQVGNYNFSNRFSGCGTENWNKCNIDDNINREE